MTHTPSTVNDNHQCVPPILQPQRPEFRELIKRAPSGIGLISGKRMTGSDEWDEIITVAVSTEFVADLFAGAAWMRQCRKRRCAGPLL